MNTSDTKSAVQKIAGFFLIAAGVGAGVWVSAILVEVLTFLYLLYSSANVLQDYGVTEYAAKFVGLVFATVVTLGTRSVIKNMLKLNRRWVPVLAGMMAAWFGIMFIVASPFEGSPFNIFNGHPGVYYRDQYRRIHPMPRGAKVGPNGERIIQFDREAADEYQRQTGGVKKSSSLWQKVFSDNGRVSARDSEENLVLWIEKMELFSDQTVIRFAAQSKDGSTEGYLRPASASYLADDFGRSYNEVAISIPYDGRMIVRNRNWFIDPYSAISAQEIRVGEVYHFFLTFPPLPQDISQLRLFLDKSWIEKPLEVTDFLAEARWEASRVKPAPAADAMTLQTWYEFQANQAAERRSALDNDRAEGAVPVPIRETVWAGSLSSQYPNIHVDRLEIYNGQPVVYMSYQVIAGKTPPNSPDAYLTDSGGRRYSLLSYRIWNYDYESTQVRMIFSSVPEGWDKLLLNCKDYFPIMIHRI